MISRSPFQRPLAAFAAWTLLAVQIHAQEPAQVVQKASLPLPLRSYAPTYVPPVHLKNTTRLQDLIRGGKLYLTLQDTIALAIENNLDLEIDRYGPLNAEWNLNRARAGGALRGVTGGNTLSNQATSGQGVQGSQVAAGLSGNGGSGSGGGSAGVVQQIGPVTQNLDPVFQNVTAFQHSESPQSNTTQSQTDAIIGTHHIINSFVQEGLLTGGYVQIAANESYLKENAPTDVLNPSVAPVVQLTVRHQFLQGFGIAVNRRFITVAEKQIGAARETFRSQLLNTVASVVNLYWGLVAADDEVAVRRRALEAGQKFLEDTRKQIALGAEARADIYRPESDLSTRKQDLAIAEVNVQQQESLLKNAISRNGTEDPLIDAVDIVPLDHLEVPASEELPGLRDLLARALAKRPDVVLSKISDETGAITALGSANTLLPFLVGLYSTTNVGLAGKAVPGNDADPYYVGGLGTALGQVFRRNFYSQRGVVGFEIFGRNRTGQADYAIDELQLRQGDLIERRNMNQIVVDISNQMIALRQARTRYLQARDTRALQQELLQKEQQMFSFGAAQIADVVAARNSLLTAQLTEVQAVAAYGRARVALDQVLGETLETNHVSLREGLDGHVSRPSKIAEKQ